MFSDGGDVLVEPNQIPTGAIMLTTKICNRNISPLVLPRTHDQPIIHLANIDGGRGKHYLNLSSNVDYTSLVNRFKPTYRFASHTHKESSHLSWRRRFGSHDATRVIDSLYCFLMTLTAIFGGKWQVDPTNPFAKIGDKIRYQQPRRAGSLAFPTIQMLFSTNVGNIFDNDANILDDYLSLLLL